MSRYIMKYNNRTGCQVLCQIGDTPSPPCQKNKYRLYIFTDSKCTQLYDYTKNSVGIDEFVYIVDQNGNQTEHQIKTDGTNWLRSNGSVMIAVDTACNQINDDNLYAHTVMEC